MVNQICIGGLIEGLAEALHFARHAGLDIEKVIDTISKGAAQSWQMENRWRTMIEGKFDFGFAVDWVRKDFALIFEEARRERREPSGDRARRPVLRRNPGDGRRAMGHVEPDRAARARALSIARKPQQPLARSSNDRHPLHQPTGNNMTASIIDGKAIAAKLSHSIAEAVKRVTAEHGIEPGLAVVLVGENPASEIYVRSKTAKTAATNMRSLLYKLPATARADELFALIDQLNQDPAVHGILVQLPLPPQIDSRKVIEAIAPAKDVDGFHPLTAGLLSTGLPGIVPCTPLACIILAKHVHGSLAGLEAVVIGRSNIVGKPLAQLMLMENATVTIAHSKTRDLPSVCRRGDIVFAAVGQPEMVRRRLDQARRHRHRRRHQPRGRRGRHVEARRRRGLRRSRSSRRCHHAGAGRRRSDDHRLSHAQYVEGRLRAERVSSRRPCPVPRRSLCLPRRNRAAAPW